MSKDKRVYISGPMSGVPREQYMEMFRRAEQSLRDRGYQRIVNPIRVWACRWPWLYRIVGYRLTLWYDLQLLKRCDAIYLLNGWKDSKGAYIEFKLALRRNLYVMTEQTGINVRFDILGYVATLAKETWTKNK